jgi:hypothetical protein
MQGEIWMCVTQRGNLATALPAGSHAAVCWKQAVAPGCRVSRSSCQTTSGAVRHWHTALSCVAVSLVRKSISLGHARTAEARSKRWTAESACCVQRWEPGLWAMPNTRPCCGMQHAVSRHRSRVERHRGRSVRQ